ncbi:23S rRNA (adenine(2503)-C(2))-methyltransferase RlmN [Algiphilus aromaticivorans]|uniref:23S rRNA (adenine(2503)-C(2))-methyltransferase RlmN n=1 Tax=Algiphilus aromaticivorans TaxID=382454 RepID=UPI000AD7A0BA|nr:23S rRNA (adenine(2503)-C(2))-methyltransferase RlmN [Algiphilus aromaticivorans]
MSAEVINLFGHDRAGLRAALAEMGEKPFRADQLMQWIYRHGVDDFGAMTNLSLSLRDKLAEHCTVAAPEVLAHQESTDGTRKWVLAVGGEGEQAVETVFIPEGSRGSERYRGTLCISSQVGCAMDCSFCSTGKQGLSRNLTAAEIVAQLWFAAHALSGNGDLKDQRAITNVVFMGMGEPLANYAAVLTAIRVFLDDFGFGLSKRRVTVSTSGLVPFMDRLRGDCDTAMAVSLHAADDALRNELVPINRKYPLDELMAACRRYTADRGRKTHIVYEYVMLDGVNDADSQARDLAKLLGDLPAKVNLIPFNPFPGAPYERSAPARVDAFQEQLRRRNIVTTVRRTRGDDIDAACGQLVGRVTSRQRNRLGGIPVVRA